MKSKTISIIGGGSAGLMAASLLSKDFNICIYEKGRVLGRKFLVAGNGGFNLTNEASGDQLHSKYTQHPHILSALKKHDTSEMRSWLELLGISTYIGSSGRVFPQRGITPNKVLNSIKTNLKEKNVGIYTSHEFIGFDAQQKPILKNKDHHFTLESDIYIFALGGASWKKTGSDGTWLEHFKSIGIETLPFEASNCGVQISWPEEFVSKYAGQPLKNIELSTDNMHIKGEALITEYGLEGNAVYPLIPLIRQNLFNNNKTELYIDFKPQQSIENLESKLLGKKITGKEYGKILNLNPLQLNLLKYYTSKSEYTQPSIFISHIKHLKLDITALRPIDEAISVVGGIELNEITDSFKLKKYPHLYITGEMLNWDAPTGGFLLQGCFSISSQLTEAINQS